MNNVRLNTYTEYNKTAQEDITQAEIVHSHVNFINSTTWLMCCELKNDRNYSK